MNEQAVRKVFAAYKLKATRFLLPEKGYRNTSFPAVLDGDQRVNFILYKNELGIYQRIARIHTVSRLLADKGLPVRAPLGPTILRIKTPRATRFGAMYGYLSGHTIPWEGYTKNHIKLVGMAMGTMHAHLQESVLLEAKVTDEYQAIVRRMKRYFTDENVTRALSKKLGLTVPENDFSQFHRLLDYCDSLPHQQVLHMDFVRGNLLFRKPHPGDVFVIQDVALSGILDFEKAAYGAPIIDVARTLAFLLVDCKYKSPEKVKKYFLHSGYNKRSQAMPVPFHSPLLDRLVALFLTYDFYKFLRHNPYEFLDQNQHFTRTRDVLLNLNMVRYTKDREGEHGKLEKAADRSKRSHDAQ